MKEAKNVKRKVQSCGVLLIQGALLSFSFFALHSTPSFAVEIEPMRLEYSLEPGKTYSGSFTLKNPSNSSLDVSVSTGGYRYVFSEGAVAPKEGRGKLPSCQDWIQFKKTKLNLTPGGSAKADFLIKVPADASHEHLCAVVFDERMTVEEAKLKKKEKNVQVQVVPRFCIPVYIAMKPGQKIGAEIQNIEAVSQGQTGGVTVKITLANTGNVHIRPEGSLLILDEKGDVVKNLPIGKCLPIFPGYKEVVPVICKKLQPGKYSAVVTIEVQKGDLIQGKAEFNHLSSKS